MTVREFLKVIYDAKIANAEPGCYKRLFLTTKNLEGKIVSYERSFTSLSEVESKLLDLNIIKLEEVSYHEFLISDGLIIRLVAAN